MYPSKEVIGKLVMWSGVEWSGVEWSVVQRRGVEWSVVECSGVKSPLHDECRGRTRVRESERE